MVKSLETALRNKSGNQLSGVIATLQSALSRLNTPEIFWLLSGDDFSLNLNDPANPCWLSIGNVPDLADTFAPVISLITTVALKQMNQQGKHKSMVILDEAPTIFIPHIDRIPATARSNKLAFAYCAQDLSQIEKAYGRVNMEAIIGNLNNQFYGRLTSHKSAEHVSKMFGKDDFLYDSYSENQSSNPSGNSSGSGTSQSYRERDRVRPQQLLQFDPGKFACFLVESNTKELIANLERRMCKRFEMPIVHPEIDFKGNFKAIYEEVKGIIPQG
jgi:type IV secretory pathway TraG/TraD family ATPase VirD4